MTSEKRLIDANALLNEIDNYMKSVYGCPLTEVADFQGSNNNTKLIYTVEGLYEATEIIDEASTVDAVEVVHGRLGVSYMDEYYGEFANCLACGTDNILPCHYCRNCGAKMDGDGNA